uniref:Uncharacterized protein n=1 Tax=Plectus sambesii TaxID=2011161 RepID=A0A914XNE8_9BILA
MPPERRRSWAHRRRKSMAGDMVDFLEVEGDDNTPQDNDDASTIYFPNKNPTEQGTKSEKTKDMKRSSSENDLQSKSSGSADSGRRSLLNATHPYLAGYQTMMQGHLAKMNQQIELQIREMKGTVKEQKRTRSDTIAMLHSQKVECDRMRQRLTENASEMEAIIGNRSKLDEELNTLKTTVELEEKDLSQEQREERETRMKLNRVNELIGRIFGDAKVQQDDVAIVSNAAKKAEKEYATIEKEKRLQDAYVERLRRDVAVAEQELENVSQKIDNIQRKHNEQKATVDILNQKLAAVTENQQHLDDHWQKLLKTLHKQDEKIKSNKVHVDTHQYAVKHKSSEDHAIARESRKTKKTRQRLEERIAELEAALQSSATEVDALKSNAAESEEAIAKCRAQIDEASGYTERLNLETANARHVYTKMKTDRKNKQSLNVNDRSSMVSANTEMETQLDVADELLADETSQLGALKKKTELYTDLIGKNQKTLDKLTEQVRQLEGAAQTRQAEKQSHTKKGKSSPRKGPASSEQESISHSSAPAWPQAASKDSPTSKPKRLLGRDQQKKSNILEQVSIASNDTRELRRREMALEYKRERLDGELEKNSELLKTHRKRLEALDEEVKQLTSAKQQAAENIKQLKETKTEDSDRKAVEQAKQHEKAQELEEKVEEIKKEIDTLAEKLQDAGSQAENWTEKIEKVESRVPSQIQKDEERAAEMSTEIRHMEIRHNQLLKEIRAKTKTLEMSVQRRDLIVDKAHITGRTNGKVKSQMIQSIEYLRGNLKQLKKDLALAQKDERSLRTQFDSASAD